MTPAQQSLAESVRNIPLTKSQPVPCECAKVALPVGVMACIDDAVHHSPEVCEPCPVGAL